MAIQCMTDLLQLPHRIRADDLRRSCVRAAELLQMDSTLALPPFHLLLSLARGSKGIYYTL